jgi:hypothetical protein
MEAAFTGRLGQPVGETCRSCRTDRPIAAFSPCRFTVDGYSGRCRACVAAATQRDRESASDLLRSLELRRER